MRSIEEQIGVTENAKKAFREEILIRMSSLARRGQTLRLHLPRAAARGDREEAVRRPAGRGQDHDLDQDARRRAAARGSTTWSTGWSPSRATARVCANELLQVRRHAAESVTLPGAFGRSWRARRVARIQRKRRRMPDTSTVSQHDWSLHRKGPIDQARHNEKVKEAIKQNLAGHRQRGEHHPSDGKKIVKVPIRSLDEYRFRYDHDSSKHVGQGDGDSQGRRRDRRSGGQARAGQGPAGGRGAGRRLLRGRDHRRRAGRADLRGPGAAQPARRSSQQSSSREAVRFTDIRKHGRHVQPGQAAHDPGEPQAQRRARATRAFGDIRTTTCASRPGRPTIQHESNAVVIAMMDVSGSMGEFEKYIARSFYFWMVRFLRTKYNNVEIVFITHHTEAKEVTEEEFFTTARAAARRSRRPTSWRWTSSRSAIRPEDWNIYPFHFSDGDNWAVGQPALRRAGRAADAAVQHLRLRRDPRGRLPLVEHADVGFQHDRRPQVHRRDDHRPQGEVLSRAAPLLHHARYRNGDALSIPATPRSGGA